MSKKLAKLKRLVTIIIISAIAVTMITPLSVSANSVDDAASSADIISNKKLYNKYKELCDRIASSINNLEDQVYIADLQFEEKHLPYIMKTVIRMHPEFFFVNTKQFATGRDESGKVAVICPFYLMDKKEIPSDREVFDKRVNEILSLIDDGMSDLQKALIIHDEIALTCTYINEETNVKYVSAYDCLISQKANCQGYAGAYSHLLSLAGITSEIVESSEMFHVWNNVCIDGEFYNVDLTWDDPVTDRPGHVLHKYFLLSNDAIIKGDEETAPYYGFDYETYKCTSTKYDKARFHSIDTRFCYVGNDCYVIDNKYGSTTQNCLLKINPETGETATIEKFNYKWMSGATSYWKNGYMSLDVHNELLYFNTPDKIFTYDVKADKKNEFVTGGNAAKIDGDYYGLIIKDGDVYVAAGKDPNSNWTLYNMGACVELPAAVGIFRKITLSNNMRVGILFGDVNGDKVIDVTDATDIQKSIAELIAFDEAQKIAADVDGDGEINVIDSTTILKYIVGL